MNGIDSEIQHKNPVHVTYCFFFIFIILNSDWKTKYKSIFAISKYDYERINNSSNIDFCLQKQNSNKPGSSNYLNLI